MLTLKNIKLHLGLSEETYAYTATVYVDGQKAVQVSNAGHGGCDRQHAINPDGSPIPNGHTCVAEIDKWCADNLPKWEVGGELHNTTLEIWCADQVSLYLTRKDMNRVLRVRPLFVKKDERGIFEMKFKGVKKYDSRMARIVLERHPDATVLNDLSENEAFKLYQQHGG